MFINELKIEEFRGIKHCKNPLEFSNFTVLIGKNNSGKSTVLEALSLLPSPKVNNYISGTSRVDYLRTLYVSPSGSFRRLLYQYAGISRLEYNLQGNRVVYLKITEDNLIQFFNKEKVVYNTKFLSNYFGVHPDLLKHLVMYIPFSTSVMDDLETRMEQLKNQITKYGYHTKLAEILNECVNDDYSEIVFLKPLSLRKVVEGNIVYIELRDLGSGAEKVIKIMALAELVPPKLLLIDDFEAGLHPTLIKIFLKWLEKKDFQTIISTHNIDVLDRLVEINPTDASLLLLNKSQNDILNYKVFTLEKLEKYLNANSDPRLLADGLGL